MTGLPDYTHHPRDFARACTELRHKITYTTGTEAGCRCIDRQIHHTYCTQQHHYIHHYNHVVHSSRCCLAKSIYMHLTICTPCILTYLVQCMRVLLHLVMTISMTGNISTYICNKCQKLTPFDSACIMHDADHTLEHPKYGEYVPAVRNEQSMPANRLPEQFASMWDGIANDPNLNWHDSEVGCCVTGFLSA